MEGGANGSPLTGTAHTSSRNCSLGFQIKIGHRAAAHTVNKDTDPRDTEVSMFPTNLENDGLEKDLEV